MMMFILATDAAPPGLHFAHAHEHEVFSGGADVLKREDAGFYSCMRVMISFDVGETEYSLRRQTRGFFFPLSAGKVEFAVDGFGHRYVGHGASNEDAYRDWCARVHTSFQQLLRKRPFEMTPEDEAQWDVLEEQIDVPKYRRNTPITMRQVGRVRYLGRSVPSRIDWANRFKDNVSLEKMPTEFAALLPDQWFEAVVRRDPLTGKLLDVRSVQPKRPVSVMTKDEQLKFLRALPEDTSLPEPDIDLSTRN